ncbi:MAG TPA: hypothetical protein VJB89_02090 [Candidatus Nanoarchaeia archaeon]|nr:hypothetical protein [Candidatus Nanoarchaeia archaeon]
MAALAIIFVIITIIVGIYLILKLSKHYVFDRTLNSKEKGKGIINWLSPSARRERKKQKLGQQIEIKKLKNQKGKKIKDTIRESNKKYLAEIQNIERNLPKKTITDKDGRVMPNPEYVNEVNKTEILKDTIQLNDAIGENTDERTATTEQIATTISEIESVTTNLAGSVTKEIIKSLIGSTLSKTKIYQSLEINQRDLNEEETNNYADETERTVLALSNYKTEDLTETKIEYTKLFDQQKKDIETLKKIIIIKSKLAAGNHLPEIDKFNRGIIPAEKSLLELYRQMQELLIFFFKKTEEIEKNIESCIASFIQERNILRGDKNKRLLLIQATNQLNILESILKIIEEIETKVLELKKLIESFEKLNEEINTLELEKQKQQEKSMQEYLTSLRV